MKLHALRLYPGNDLKHELMHFVAAHGIQAACLITCVGSLQRATIRCADRTAATVFDQKMEILSLCGTLSSDGVHLHIGLADGDGQARGGHLMDGCIIYTTAEVVLAEVPDVVFSREYDPATDCNELVVRRK